MQGSYYFLIKKYDLAWKYFKKASRLDKHFAPGWIAFGHAFAALDETEQNNVSSSAGVETEQNNVGSSAGVETEQNNASSSNVNENAENSVTDSADVNMERNA